MDEADIQLRREFNHAEAKECSKEDMAPRLAVPLPQGSLDAVQGALVSGQFSDLTLVCREQTFKTHRLIVCSQSPVLATLCAESEVRASKIQPRPMTPRLSRQFSGLINLNAHDLEAVRNMIEFLYTGHYNTIDTSPTFSLHTHTRVYGLALHYQIKGLVTVSAANFAASLRRVRDLEVYFQSIRDAYSLPAIMNEASLHLAAQNQADSCHPAYHLRIEVIDAAITELPKILSLPAVLARFQEICTEVPQFHADFLNFMLETRVETESHIGAREGEETPALCGNCGPREEGYEIEVQCRSCGKKCSIGFH